MEIMIYFNCGVNARMDAERTAFMDGVNNLFDCATEDGCSPSVQAKQDAGAFIQGGGRIVNWGNVCFVRRIEPPKEENEE